MQRFDVGIIGSSPLLLLQALRSAGEKKSVCVIDRDAVRGGMWQNTRIGEEINTEIACHLIEPFPGVYEHLEDVSGIAFASLEGQPLRVSPNKRTIRYSSSYTIMAAAFMAHVRLVKGYLRKRFRSLNPSEAHQFQDALVKVLDLYRYQIPVILRGPVVKAPVTGLSDWFDALLARCEEVGIVFTTLDVGLAEHGPDGWRLAATGSDATVLAAQEVYCSASANLHQDSETRFSATPFKLQSSWHVLIEVADDAMHQQVSYSVFPRDTNVFRVSRIDQPKKRDGHTLFLVQLWQNIEDPEEITKIVARSLMLSEIIREPDAFRIIGDISFEYTPYDLDVQLIEGEVAPGFHVLSSAGNLASGIASWLKGNRRFSLRRKPPKFHERSGRR